MQTEPDKKIGQLLIGMGAVGMSDVAEALEAQTLIEHQHSKKMKLGEILLFDGRINMDQLTAALRLQVQRGERSRQRSAEAKQAHELQYREIASRGSSKSAASSSFWGNLKRKFLKN